VLLGLASLPTFAQTAYEPLGPTVNSYADEQHPVVSPDGQRLYFTRRGHADNVGGRRDPGDIWYSERIGDQQWSAAKHAGTKLNNAHYNGVVGFDSQGRLLVHGHYQPDGSPARTQGLSVAVGSGDGWSVPEAVDIPYFYTKSAHRSGNLHRSGDIIIVTLQSYDTRGGEDLYVLFRQGDGWTEPRNLGPTVNTAYQEMTPFLTPDGKTLFFASNGYEGFGSRDIYVSVRLDDTWKNWSNPKNLGPAVNSEGTELSYYVPEESAYAYLSTTQNSDGLGDLVRVRISEEQTEQLATVDTTIAVPVTPEPEPAPADTVTATEEPPAVTTVAVRGTVTNKNAPQPVVAELTFRSLKKDTTQVTAVRTDPDGTFSVPLPPDDDYILTVAAEGFIPARDRVSTGAVGAEALVRDYALTPLEVGATVNLENVLFDRGNATMLPGSYETLDEVVELLKENPDLEIEVAGHTDNQGRADLNLALSEERAVAVKQYLVEQGVDAGRIVERGYGGTRPLVSNAIEEERSKNRRVEFTILKK
jgi:outer membrane protein OmpA-like peptidoglycan-associated protein